MNPFVPNDPANPFAAWMPPFLNPGGLNPFAGMPGATAGSASDASAWMKALDPVEIERRIGELKVVEMWLQTQVNMVQMSVQTLTLQKQSMEALHQATQGLQTHGAAISEAAQSFSVPKKPRPRKR